MSDSLRKHLKELAQLSLLANRISEIQEKNLKMFPFVFFENLKEVKIDYDLGHGMNESTKQVHHKSSVSYYLTIEQITNNDINNNIDKRFLALEASVRNLFWKDILVKVFINDKLAYESKDV